jgi:hypothetical protein
MAKRKRPSKNQTTLPFVSAEKQLPSPTRAPSASSSVVEPRAHVTTRLVEGYTSSSDSDSEDRRVEKEGIDVDVKASGQVYVKQC